MSEFHDPDFLSDIADNDRREMEEYCDEYKYEARYLQELSELESDMTELDEDDDYVRKLIYQAEDLSDHELEQGAKWNLFWGL